jgi:arylsulfatase A-like enzyme
MGILTFGSRRNVMSRALFVTVLIAFLPLETLAADRPPNVVILFVDDMGYGDLSCYGAKGYHTPNLDRMASEGMKFTDFYVGQAVCSASRAALLTGCYPVRVGILGALSPESKTGISDREILLPQILKKRGYATALYGKWHLGDSPQFLPTRHGFDEYFGLPYSNDMLGRPDRPNYPKLPLVENEKVLQRNPDQSQLVTWYTEHALSFISRHKDAPFFLEVAHNMPHVPLHVSDKFKGKTERGLYGDVLEEIDWSVGQILSAIKSNGLEDNTLVIFTSDNGPWLLYGDHAGSAGPLREGKATTFDGGVRECCIMRWPGKIPAGQVCREMAWSMDVLPTVAKLTGGQVPNDRIIDGKDIWPLVAGAPGAKTPHEAYYYYWGRELQAIRSGNWKLHLPHDYVHPDPAGKGGKPGKYATLKIAFSLYDLGTDVGEERDVAARHPDVVKRLEDIAARARADLGDSRTKTAGANIRDCAHLENPTGFRDQAVNLPRTLRPDGLVHAGED